MNSPIILGEVNQRFVTFALDQTQSEHYIVYSTTITIDYANPVHNQLIGYINDFDHVQPILVDHEKDKFISIVFVDPITDESQRYLNNEIRGLLSNPANGSGYGIVITFNNDGELTLLHKPKRTSGKVSNTLG